MPETSRAARLSKLRGLLEEERYASQQELADALGEAQVSQSTLSKDLMSLGAIRRRAEDGSLIYALPGSGEIPGASLERLARLCAELVQSLQYAGNQMVIKTPPGAAQFFAAAFDAARLVGVMGTIAGDDTVLVIATDEAAMAGVLTEVTEMTRTGKVGEK